MIKISVSELEKLYHSNFNREVCKKLGISHPTLVTILKQNNIPLKGKGNGELKRKIEVTK